MGANVGRTDRIARLVVAVLAVAGAVMLGSSGPLAIVLYVVGAIMAVTAAVGFCPLYRIFGFSTCPVRRS